MKNCTIAGLILLCPFLAWLISGYLVELYNPWRIWGCTAFWAVSIAVGFIFTSRAAVFRDRPSIRRAVFVLRFATGFSLLWFLFCLLILIPTGGHPRP